MTTIKKHILILTTFLLTLTAGQGQTNVYHPLPDTNAHWREGYWTTNFSYNPPCVYNDAYTLFLSNDTILGTKTYHKLLKSGTWSTSYCLLSSNYYNQYAGAIRQDSLQKKVYYVPSYNNTEQLLYDFNLQVGDTLHTSFNYGMSDHVIGIDSVLVGSKFHKRFLLNVLGQAVHIDTTFALIEGVGSMYGLYNPLTPPFESGGNLYCFSHNGQNYPSTSSCGFTNGLIEINNQEDNFSIYPNPFTTLTNLTINLTDLTVTIYNLCGQPVKQVKTNSRQTVLNRDNLPNGLYFLRVTKDNKTVASDKLVIVDN